MKAYLSYPMTHVCPADLVEREIMRNALNTCDIPDLKFYDPEIHEPEGAPLMALQELDLMELSQSDVLIVVWSASTDASKGVAAEIEWAKRIFALPVLVYYPKPLMVSPWTKATLCLPPTYYCVSPENVISVLRQLPERTHHVQ